MIIEILIFLVGLAVGSFLNCVIYRMENKKSFISGRSFCPRCNHVLAWHDLVPILSFLALRGRCRYCRKKISFQYLLAEMGTAITFLLCFLFKVPWIAYIAVPFLIIIFVFDLKHYLIPDKIVYPAIAAVFLYDLYNLDFGAFGAALGAAAFFLAIVLISREKWMGVGDVKLAFLMGLLLGWPNILPALFLAFGAGAIMGLCLIALDKKSLKSAVPFGPFLVFGTVAALFWGQSIVNWYLRFILR